MTSSCKICGQSDDLHYRCNYCNQTFCADHRLPEQHDCPGLEIVNAVDSRWFSKDTDIDPREAQEIELPPELVGEITDTPNLEDRSAAVQNQKKREAIDMVSDSAKVAGGEVVIGQESKPYETVEPSTVGTSIEPEYESSPDLNPDGSLQTDENPNENTAEGESSELWSETGQLLLIFLIVGVLAYLLYFVVL